MPEKTCCTWSSSYWIKTNCRKKSYSVTERRPFSGPSLPTMCEKIDAMSYFDDVNADGNAPIHLATINNHSDII